MKRRRAASTWLALALGGCAPMAGPVASGDPVRGERAFLKCYSCHSIEPGEHGYGGPSLYESVDRPIASVAGFDYSAPMRALSEREMRWSADLLDRFITDPEAVVPGTDMTFTGMEDAAERADLIAYLRENDRDSR
ncbi:MAG: c-type cytochrome [Sphingomonadaceae bacterium]|nr:c-type cytochrome [Sphingomonadaceae bacterium]